MPQLALIKTDDHWLAVPHHCIATIEASADSETMWIQQTPCNVIRHPGRTWPVVGLNKQLQPFIGDSSARLVVCFKQPAVALRCEEVSSIDVADVCAVPTPMHKQGQGIDGFAVYEGQLVLVLNAVVMLQRMSEVVAGLQAGESACSVTPGY